jgi:hypothetical protein
VSAGQNAAWTVTFDSGFVETIRSVRRMLFAKHDADLSFENREFCCRELKKLNDFDDLVSKECVKSGIDQHFQNLIKFSDERRYYLRVVGPWYGYCYADIKARTIQWVTVLHEDQFRGLCLDSFLKARLDREKSDKPKP